MVEILDIFLTKKDTSANSSYKDEIIVKVKDLTSVKYFASTMVGFIKVEPYDVRGGYNEKLFDNIKDISLITDIAKTFPLYYVNPLFNLDSVKAIIIDAPSGRHAVGVDVTTNQKPCAAYSLNIDEGRRYHFHKQDISVKREDVVNSIAKNLEILLGEEVRVKTQNQNVNE